MLKTRPQPFQCDIIEMEILHMKRETKIKQ